MPDPSQDPTPDIAQLDLPFVEAKLDEILRSMTAGLKAWLPPSWWFPARRSARIIVARVQFYPAGMAREARATDRDALAIPLFLGCADTGWDPFGDGGRRADNIFDRAAGMKSPPVEPGPGEQHAHAMAKIGAGTLETQGTLLPPCHVPPSIGGRDDMFLIGAGTSWFSLPRRRFWGLARYPLIVFRGRAQWAGFVAPAWFWNESAYAERARTRSGVTLLHLPMQWALRSPIGSRVLRGRRSAFQPGDVIVPHLLLSL